MLRPIDTQILYPNSPELSNKQQVDTQKPNVQQNHFAESIQKEVKHNQEKVEKAPKKEKVENKKDEKKRNSNHSSKDQKDKKKTVEEKSKQLANEVGSQFDIRI